MNNELVEFFTDSADSWRNATVDAVFSPSPEPDNAVPPTPIRYRVPLASSRSNSKPKKNVPRIVENPLATRAPRIVNKPLWIRGVDGNAHLEVARTRRAESTSPRSPAVNHHHGNNGFEHFPLVVADTPPFIALTPPQDTATEDPTPFAETPRFISLSPALSRNASLTLENSSLPNGGFAYIPLIVDTPRYTSLTPSVASSRHVSPETDDVNPPQRSSIPAASPEAEVESDQEEWEDVPQASSSKEVKKTQKVNKMRAKIPRKVGVRLNAGGFPEQGLMTVRKSKLARMSKGPHKTKKSRMSKRSKRK